MGISSSHLRLYVIKPTLEFLNMWSPAAENLLLGTAAQESLLGFHLKQVNGPALGIYQIEPMTHTDILANLCNNRPDLTEKLKHLVNFSNSVEETEKALITNLSYSTAIARLVYYRAPDELPDANDVEGLAYYWKKFYNTVLGKGLETSFIKNYQKYISKE